MKKNITIDDLRADSGFFPVDNDGVWHSGVHIGINENEEISSPVNGKIIAANVETQNEEKDNYFWLCEELNIPIKNGKFKPINVYSLLSNIESYKKYTNYPNYPKFTSIKDYDTSLFSKNGDLPFGIHAVIDTELYEIPYIQLFDDDNDFHFLHSTYFENFGTGKDLRIGRYNPKCEEKEIDIKFKRAQKSTRAFITTDLTKDGITCPKWTVGNIDSGDFIPEDNSRLKYDELKTKEGYIAVDGKSLTITPKGCIFFKSPEYFMEKQNSNILEGKNLIIIRKNEKEKIKKSLEKIENEILYNNDELNDLKSRLERLNKQLKELNKQKNIFGKYKKEDAHLAVHEKEVKKEFKESEREFSNAQEKDINLSTQQYIFSSIYNKFEVDKKDAILLILNEKKIEETFKQSILIDTYLLYKKDLNNLELFISNETIIRDELLKNLYNDLLKKFKDNKITYTECSTSDFSEVYKEKIHSEMVTGLKVLYQGKEKSRSIGVFKCSPYLFIDTGEYRFPFENQKINLYSEKIIKDYADAKPKTKKGVLIFSDSDVSYKNERDYNKEPISIASGEYEITNLNELIKANIEKEKISIEDDKYYKCKLSVGYAFIKGKDLKIKLVIDKSEKLKNKQIEQNTFLGHARKNRPYLDWSTFFYDNLLEIEPEKTTLEIPGGIKCKKIEKPKKQMFLSNNTYIKTSEVKDNQDFAKLEELKVVITIYGEDNKDCIEKNKDGTIKIKDNINELYFYYHSYKFKKDEKSGEVKLSGGDKFSQYVQDGITTESEEVKIYAEKIILPKILNKTIKWDSNGTTGTHPDPNSYKFTITITPEEIATAYNFTSPLYIDKKTISLKLNNERNYGKGQIFTVYNDKENEIETTIPSTEGDKPVYSNDSYVESKDDLYITVNGIKYKIENKQLEQYKTDVLKDYWKKLIPMNYKHKNYTQVTDEKICPSDSLLCKVKELKEKFKEAEKGIFAEYLDYDKNGVGSNRIYKEDAYKSALKAGINRLIAYHPLEFDKELHSDLMDKVLPHIKIEEFSEETDNNIAAQLPIKEENKDQNTKIEIKENKFYFVYPPLFDEIIEKSKIREFNPYEGKMYTEIHNDGLGKYEKFLEKQKTKEYDSSLTVISTSGFAPYYGGGNRFNSYGFINGFFEQAYDSKSGGFYAHEGVDFEGKQVDSSNTDKKSRTPIQSFIYGVVVKLGDQGDSHYGKHLVVSDGNNCLYLLGHLYDYEDGIQVGTPVYPEMIVGYVGNTGNCISSKPKSQGGGTHLHVSVYVTDEAKNIAEAKPNKDKTEKLDNLLWDKQNKNYLTKGKKFKLVNPFDHSDNYLETL